MKEEKEMSRRNRLPELVIDPEFESYVPPLTQEEFDLLEENILCMHRVMEPIIVWEGNIIVDGHNRLTLVSIPEKKYWIGSAGCSWEGGTLHLNSGSI